MTKRAAHIFVNESVVAAQIENLAVYAKYMQSICKNYRVPSSHGAVRSHWTANNTPRLHWLTALRTAQGVDPRDAYKFVDEHQKITVLFSLSNR